MKNDMDRPYHFWLNIDYIKSDMDGPYHFLFNFGYSKTDMDRPYHFCLNIVYIKSDMDRPYHFSFRFATEPEWTVYYSFWVCRESEGKTDMDCPLLLPWLH